MLHDIPTRQILPGVLLALGIATKMSSTWGHIVSLPRNRRADLTIYPLKHDAPTYIANRVVYNIVLSLKFYTLSLSGALTLYVSGQE